MSRGKAPSAFLLLALSMVLAVAMGAARVPAQNTGPAQSSDDAGAGSSKEMQGEALYAVHCAPCHEISGAGRPPAVPRLEDNSRLRDLEFVVRRIRQGRGAMPAFPRLVPEEVAALAAYLRSAWGNDFGKVETGEVRRLLDSINHPSVPASTPAGGWYTVEQALRGKEFYEETCAQCHGADFVPDDFAPGLTGAAFDWGWKSRSVYDLFEKIRSTMPPGGTGTLGPQTTIDIVAYLLKSNGFPPGSRELPPLSEELQVMKLARPAP
jgi:mono/diheme cytochrome c family protein